MLWTVCVVLLALWALGLVTSYTMGGFVHILLVLALVMVVINLVLGRRAVEEPICELGSPPAQVLGKSG